MSLEDLFTRYGSPSKEGEYNLRGWFQRADTLRTVEDVAANDTRAARLIRECEAAIQTMTEYRQTLAARYAELETMPYTERVEINRKPAAWTGDHVKYYIRIMRRYSDGTEAEQHYESFPGKQRREALKRFEEIRKQRPGIEAVKDIERRSWER